MNRAFFPQFLVVASTAFAAPAFAGNEQSSITAYSGFYAADNGVTDRWVLGGFGDYYEGAAGFHADVAYVRREENALFGAVGVSHVWRHVRFKLMGGTSTHNSNIMPNIYVAGSAQFKPTAQSIVTPSLTYRSYRAGGSELAPAVQVAQYFDIPSDQGGYFVAQANAGLSFTSSNRIGWSAGAGLSTIRKSGLTFGAAVRTGYLSYDSGFGTGVRSTFRGGSATLGYRLPHKSELFVRAEVTRSRLYTVSGAMLGFKVPL